MQFPGRSCLMNRLGRTTLLVAATACLWVADRHEALPSEPTPSAVSPLSAPTTGSNELIQLSSAPIDAGHSTRTVVDWPGYYAGTVPCGSCPGIDMWLVLNEFDGATTYTLIERYQAEGNSTFRSSGRARWRADGSALELTGEDDPRVLFVSEGYVEFLGEGQQRGDGRSAYVLRKLAAYAGKGEQLLVDPARVTTSKRKGKTTVRFPALINFEHSAAAGHRSLRATFVIDCAAKRYRMPTAGYYAKDFGTGRLLKWADGKNRRAQPLISGETVIGQVAEQYCPHGDGASR